MELNVGDKAPEIVALNQKGEEIKLSSLKGKKVVLFFYPKDNTPSCTKEACNLRDNYAALQAQGYEVFGISIDSEKSHQKFIDKFELPYDLLVDEDKKIVSDYGVWQEKSMYGKTYMGTVRTTFIIDEEGNIADIIKKVKVSEHADQILG